MSNIYKKILQLEKDKKIFPPKWLLNNLHYLTIMGSQAYGTNTKDSDIDLYGFCIPTKEVVFPHFAGHIFGFGEPEKKFEQWQQHHINDEKGKEYDFSIYSIIKYFWMLKNNNPNIIDSLFTPLECVLYITPIGERVRQDRKLFLHKGSYHTYRGYAFSQLKSLDRGDKTSKRYESRQKYGYDVKFGMNLIRLLHQAEQILQEGDIDLQRHNEHLKAIRRGDFTKEEIIDFAKQKEKCLDKLYHESSLRHKPDVVAIKTLLLECLEQAYGGLDKIVYHQSKSDIIVEEIRKLVNE